MGRSAAVRYEKNAASLWQYNRRKMWWLLTSLVAVDFVCPTYKTHI